MSGVIDSGADILAALFNDEARVDDLAGEAVLDALREHKRRGQSVAVWRDGRVVILAPEDIPGDTEEAGQEAPPVSTDGANGKPPHR